MKTTLAFILFCFFFSISKAQPSVSTSFIKATHYFHTDTTIAVAALYHGKYFCLQKNHHLFLVDTLTKKVQVLGNAPDSLQLEDFTVSNDTLLAYGRYNTYYLNGNKNEWLLKQKGIARPAFYQDQDFVVTSSCSGEFGGSLYFVDKKTKQKYECSAVCALNVIRINNTYRVTTSLSHMAGFANIFDIEDPHKLSLMIELYYGKKG